MPAVMAAIVSIIFTAMNKTPFVEGDLEVKWINQLYCLLCTLGLAIVGGGGELTKSSFLQTFTFKFSHWRHSPHPRNRVPW